MTRTFSVALLLALVPTFALADDPSKDEVAKIKEALAVWGCEGGEYEKEDEASGVFEVDDAKCKAGQYDFRLNKDFKVFVIVGD